MKTWLIALGVVVAATTAHAESTKPSADVLKQYAVALQHGRAAEDAGKLDAAVTAFGTCLQLQPDDAVALSELGVVWLRKHDLAKAEDYSRKAVARAQTVSVRAASLFNLGYVLAKHGDKPGAIEAYEGSLRLRPNATVEAALRKLDPGAADTLRFAPRAMHAVTATSLAALTTEQCWKSVAEAWPELNATAADVPDHYVCSSYPVKLALAGTPLLEVAVLTSVASYQYPKEVDTLAIRTAAGWFVAPFEAVWSNRWTDSKGTIQSVELHDVGGAKAVVVRWQLVTDDWPWDVNPANEPYNGEGRTESTTAIVVAAIGTSGVPSMTPPIPVAESAAYGGTDPKPTAAAEVAVTFPPAGGITMTGPTIAKTKVPKAKFADLLGALHASSFTLAFP